MTLQKIIDNEVKRRANAAIKENIAAKAHNLQVLMIDEILKKCGSFYRAEKDLSISRVQLKRYYDCENEITLSMYLYMQNFVEKKPNQ